MDKVLKSLDEAPKELELTIPDVQPQAILLNGERYVLRTSKITPEDEQDIEEAIRRFRRIFIVEQQLGIDSEFAAALLGDSEIVELYKSYRPRLKQTL